MDEAWGIQESYALNDSPPSLIVSFLTPPRPFRGDRWSLDSALSELRLVVRDPIIQVCIIDQLERTQKTKQTDA